MSLRPIVALFVNFKSKKPYKLYKKYKSSSLLQNPKFSFPSSSKFAGNIHLHNFNSIEQARENLGKWFKFYNEQRPRQALKMKTPKQAYELHQQVA